MLPGESIAVILLRPRVVLFWSFAFIVTSDNPAFDSTLCQLAAFSGLFIALIQSTL